MVKLVGRWFGYGFRCLNFRPEYRHVMIKEVWGKPYMEDGQQWQDVLVTVYGYQSAGSKTVPYVSETWYYTPTRPLYDLVGSYQIKYDKVRIKTSEHSSDYLSAISDPQHRVAVTERFGRD